jgi:protein-tyrosine phosphatase
MKYTIIFLIFGGLFSSLACALGGWWCLLHWFSFSCFASSAGYAGLGPRVFGKRPDGRIPTWSKIIHLPYMVFAESMWRLTRSFNRENPTDTVTDDLILGRRLLVSELPGAVSNYVDLTADTEDPKVIRDSTGYIAFPILDAGVPSPVALRSVVSQLRPGRTFVHCAQGHGRACLFALALLVERHHIRSFDEGMALIKAARPRVGLNKTQEAFMRDYIAEQTHAADV